jgi:ferredoxin
VRLAGGERRGGTSVVSVRLALDPTRCDGRGMCALVCPERVGLDGWGFPVVDDLSATDRRTRRRMTRAAAACPTGALVAISDGDGLGARESTLLGPRSLADYVAGTIDV